MAYSVKEIFYTLQGEGIQSGSPAVFCRFSGCNLWSGREEDREQAQCTFCDTDFVGTDGTLGGRYPDAAALAREIARLWPSANRSHRLVVLTGGEPLLQVDHALIEALHAEHFRIAVETNGTIPVPAGVDWICVSPKPRTRLVQTSGHELKLVFPQADLMPEDLPWEELQFDHHLLQPICHPAYPDSTARAVAYCQQFPRWRLSLQTHKLIGIR